MRASDEKLVAALEPLGFPDLVKRAKAGEWNDYFGPHAMNIHHLVMTLRERKTDFPSKADDIDKVIHRAIAGDFDATKAEADEWAASGEGQATFRDLLKGR